MKKLIKILLIALVVLIVLVAALCVTATRPFFIKSVIVPIAEKNIHASITLGDVELHPFDTSLLVTDLNVKSADGYSVKSGKIFAKINLWDIIHDRITVNQVDLENTFIDAVNTPESHAASKQDKSSEKSQASSGKQFIISVSNVNIRNLNLNYETKGKTPSESSIFKITNFNLSIPELKTGGKGTIRLFGDILTSKGDASNLLNGKIESNTTLSLNDNSFPVALESKTTLTLGDKTTPMNLAITTQGKAFKFHGEIKNLNFDPFFSAFLTAPVNESVGYINNLIVDASGADYQSPDVVMEITGDAKFNIKLAGTIINFKSGSYNFTFNLSDILNNRINIRKIAVNDTSVNVVKTNNTQASAPVIDAASPEPGKTNAISQSKTPSFDLNNIEIKNFSATYVDRTQKNGETTTASLSNFNLSVPALKTGSAGTLAYDGNLSISAAGNEFNGNINGTSQVVLDSNNMPVTLDSQNNIKLNNVSSSISISAASPDGKSMKFKGTLGYLDLDPFLSMFIKGNGKEASGHIDTFEITGESSDVQTLDINTKVAGKVELNLSENASIFNLDTGYFDLGFNVKDIIDKNISVEHLTVDQAKIKIAKDASVFVQKTGNNSDRQNEQAVEPPLPKSAGNGLPFSINLNNIMVKNASFIYDSTGKSKEESSSLKISDFNLSVPRLKSDGKGQVDFSANIISSGGGDSKMLQGRVESKTSVVLNKNLFPTQLESGTNITFGKEVTPITLTVTTENEKAFKFTGNINSLNLSPIFNNFMQGPMKNSTGIINGLTINASGADFNSTDILADLTCSAKAGIANDSGLYNLSTNKFYVLVNIDDFLHNKIAIRQLDLNDTNIEVIKTKTPAPAAKAVPAVKTDAKTAPSKYPALDLNNIGVRNLNLAYILKQEDGSIHNASKISNLNITIPSLKTNERGNVDYDGDISITSAETGKTLSGKINGKTDIQMNESMLPDFLESATKLQLGQNVTPIDAKLQTDADKNFQFAASMKDLPLDPIFQTFLQGALNRSNGFMKSLVIKGNGNDIQSPNMIDTLNTDINASFTNITIPVELMNVPVTQVLFMPIIFASQLNKYLAVKVFSDDANNMLTDAANTIKGSKPLEFTRGDVDIGIKNRNVYLRKVLFVGSQQSAVSKLDVHGEIADFRSLNLDTLTVITKFNLPIHIDGTIDDPKPDMSKLAVQFVGTNVDNFVGTAKKAATLLGDNLNTETQQIIKALPDNSSSGSGSTTSQPASSSGRSGSSRSGSNGNEPPAQEIIKAGVGILKGLFDKN